MGQRAPISRRVALALGADAASLPLVHIKRVKASGKLSVLFSNSFVPGANEAMKRLAGEWGTQNKIDVETAFAGSVGSKLLLMTAAEAQARTGHDVLCLADYVVHTMPINSNRWTTLWLG